MNTSQPVAGHSGLTVSLGDRSYPIGIYATYRDAVASLTQWCNEQGDVKHVILIADAAICPNWVSPLREALAARGLRTDLVVVPSGEESKSLEQLGALWQQLLELRTDRRSVLVAAGGGVIGDLAGFAAATFTRGLRFLQMPTTLLAMVDSSVGGKTGINLPAAKNIVGAFWQPSAVAISAEVLSTLPDREYRSGLAEVVKYGIIMDEPFFEYLEANAAGLSARDGEAVSYAIRRSCECKAAVVADDERETTGRRAILNYGHTFAHAIEATAGYGAFLHGEAVAIGMAMAGRLAVGLQLIDPGSILRQNHLLDRLGLPTSLPQPDWPELWRAMQHDKKVAAGELGFILPTCIGHVQRVAGIALSDLQQHCGVTAV